MNRTGPRIAPRFDWKFPAALLLLTAVTYGPLIPGLGIYWDDWPSLWFLHFFDPKVFPHAFAIDRPVQGWLFTLTTAVLGEWMPGWYLFGILARWLCALAFAWVLRLTWPRSLWAAGAAAALFVVYPGFSQQWIPITYGHQLIVYAAFWVSMALMLLAVRMPEYTRQLTIISLALAVTCMFALEYFFGLELLRPALLWIAAADRRPAAAWRERIGYVGLRWLPYAAAACLFLGWRVTNPTPRGNIVLFDRLAAEPGRSLSDLAGRIGGDLFAAAVEAWARTAAYLNPTGVKLSVLGAYALIVLSAAALAAWLLSRLQTDASAAQPGPLTPTDARRRTAPHLQAGLLGMYALLIGGWPVWVTDLRLELSFPWDRFTLPLIPGAALLLVFLTGIMAVRRPRAANVILALLIGLSAGKHLHDGLAYRRDWIEQRTFFWQLAWRVPTLHPGTLVLASTAPFAFDTDNSLTAPLNWVYNPHQFSFDMDYLMYALDARLGTQLPELEPGHPLVQDYRATRFSGSTSQVLVIFYDPPRCLKVLDPTQDELLPNKPDDIAEALHLSRPDLILSEPDTASPTAARLFGPEPEHGWCYYFERAELAVQFGDWETAAALADQALASNPRPQRAQAYELTPFITAYALTGRWDQALEITRQAARLSDKMPAALCRLWENIAVSAEPVPETTARYELARRELACPIE